MNSEMSIELFLRNMHQQALRLLESFIWLDEVMKVQARDGCESEADKERKREVIVKIRANVIMCQVSVALAQHGRLFRRTREMQEAMLELMMEKNQEVEDMVKMLDPRTVSPESQ